jgi:hypothetical protein
MVFTGFDVDEIEATALDTETPIHYHFAPITGGSFNLRTLDHTRYTDDDYAFAEDTETTIEPDCL